MNFFIYILLSNPNVILVLIAIIVVTVVIIKRRVNFLSERSLRMPLLGKHFELFALKWLLQDVAAVFSLVFKPGRITGAGKNECRLFLYYDHSFQGLALHITLSPQLALPPGFLMSPVQKGALRRTIFQTGDPLFDVAVLVHGDDSGEILSHMDYITRSRILEIAALCKNFKLDREQWTLLLEWKKIVNRETMEKLLDNVYGLIDHFSSPKDKAAVFYAGVQADPQHGARNRFFLSHCKYFPDTSVNKQLAVSLLFSPNHDASRNAFNYLGQEAGEVLDGILARGEQMALEDDNVHSNIISMYVLAKARDAVPRLMKYYKKIYNQKIKAKVLSVLNRWPPTGELLQLLRECLTTDSYSPPILIHILGEHGGRDEVIALNYFIKNCTSDKGMKSSAQTAVQKIKARLGKVDPGWLSIAEHKHQEGGLSLSFSSSDEGKMSLSDE